MPEHVDEKTGKRLYHENETTLNLKKLFYQNSSQKVGKESQAICIEKLMMMSQWM